MNFYIFNKSEIYLVLSLEKSNLYEIILYVNKITCVGGLQVLKGFFSTAPLYAKKQKNKDTIEEYRDAGK